MEVKGRIYGRGSGIGEQRILVLGEEDAGTQWVVRQSCCSSLSFFPQFLWNILAHLLYTAIVDSCVIWRYQLDGIELENRKAQGNFNLSKELPIPPGSQQLISIPHLLSSQTWLLMLAVWQRAIMHALVALARFHLFMKTKLTPVYLFSHFAEKFSSVSATHTTAFRQGCILRWTKEGRSHSISTLCDHLQTLLERGHEGFTDDWLPGSCSNLQQPVQQH